jgi:hypothetical protein
MSKHISQIYSDEIRNHLRPLFANWQPSQPVALGDFGKLEGNIFVRLGNVKQFGIPFTEYSENRKDQQSFASKGSTEIKFNAGGSAPVGGTVNVKANLEVNFSSEDSVFFNAAECKYSLIADKVALAKEVMERFRAKKWDRVWAVVTDVIKAGATTLAVSGSKSSSIVFEATGNVPNINLGDASIGLSIKSSRNVGYQVVAAEGLTPLIGLSKIKPQFLWIGGDFQPLSMKMLNPFAIDALEASPEIQTERSEEELFFGQIME